MKASDVKYAKPKFKVGQVVCVHSFIEKRYPGEVGPGFRAKPGWRWGVVFGKIVKVIRPTPPQIATAPNCYFLAEWPSAMLEKWLRPLTSRERGDQKGR